MPKFKIQSGRHKGRNLVLPESDKEMLIGRGEECQIRLSSEDVSRQHCLLRISSGQVYVRDLGSQNGTLVNGTVIEGEQPLQPGDVLGIGPLSFQLLGQSKQQARGLEEASDDEIATWLAEADAASESQAAPSGNSTIIRKRSASEAPAGTQDRPQQAPSQPAETPASQKKFDSLAEEAADIIRRHWQKVQREEQHKKST